MAGTGLNFDIATPNSSGTGGVGSLGNDLFLLGSGKHSAAQDAQGLNQNYVLIAVAVIAVVYLLTR